MAMLLYLFVENYFISICGHVINYWYQFFKVHVAPPELC